jgi:hypothetical protein
MGLPASETLVSGSFSASQWDEVVGYGVSSVLDFFLGDNAPKRLLAGARTTPITLRQRSFPNGTVFEWTSAMMVSTAAFPDAAAIPAPIIPLHLEAVGPRLVAVKQFSVSGFPTQQDFADACAGVAPATLPVGYAINAESHWSPTFAIYSRQNAAVYECECWVEVIAA